MPESAKQLNVAIKANGDVFVGQDWVPQTSSERYLKDDLHARRRRRTW